MHKIYQMELGGQAFSVETGKLAEQADASVLVRCGDTVVLVCATSSNKPREGIDFFPLSVDYEEKLYSVGKIPGSFPRREGRPSEKAILTSRLIDRPIRPLFPKGYRNDVHIVATVISAENDVATDVWAMLGSSIALSISDIPFAGPTGSVSVGLIDGQYIINPTLAQREQSRVHLIVSGTKDAIMMVEAGAQMVSEEEMLQGILFAHEHIKKLVEFQEKIVAEIGRPKRKISIHAPADELVQAVREFAEDKIRWSLDTSDREERTERSEQVEAEVFAHFADIYPNDSKDIGDVLYNLTKEIVREKIIDQGVRPDGRTSTQVRPIWCEVGLFARTHGSAVFTRGQSQAMSIATLGAQGDRQLLDGIDADEFKRYMHHYNMPPYSVGETKPMRGPGRREIGHGALAERALEPVIPSEEEFPYVLRVVSEILSSNGSTSMASVCGSTLSLMDAGVPIKAPVAGVAMGLIKDEQKNKVAILTDIQGLEDFLGDMDFKVAGTAEGITAIQMDIKIKGIDEPILRQALEQARVGRLHILGKMLEVLDQPRAELSRYAPKIIRFSIHPDKIREVIGSGGKTINKIIADTGVKIDIEDDGSVFITTPDAEAADRARQIIEAITRDLQVGDQFRGKVVRILPIGAFVELAPGKDGMLHISKLAVEHVNRVEDVVNIGDELDVRVAEIDRQGRVNLVRTDIPEIPSRPRPERRDFGDRDRRGPGPGDRRGGGGGDYGPPRRRIPYSNRGDNNNDNRPGY